MVGISRRVYPCILLLGGGWKTVTEFDNKELAEFLEDAVEGLFQLNPNKMVIVAINDERGIAGTQYYNCGVEDKGIMIHHINEDIVMDIILNNADTIRAWLENEDEDGECDDPIESD